MSEYQYYEFQAIDHPLTQSQMRELRGFSTRAKITPTRFVNEYHWGDFKGDPALWIEKYFDAFFYYANWGSRDFMLRLPGRLFDYEIARRYCCGDSALARRKAQHVILEFHSEDDEAEDWVEDDAELSALVPLRADLTQGDHRCLYLAWLLCVQAGEVNDDAEEPPVPAGLRALTGSLRAFAEFLRIDGDLIEVAVEGSPDHEGPISKEDMKRCIESLPDAEKTRMLLESALDGTNPQSELLKKFRGTRTLGMPRPEQARTVAQLRKGALERAEARRRQARERAERERVRREQEARAARVRYLDDLAKRGEGAWARVDQLIATKQPKKYDEAVALLGDLRELAARDGRVQEHSARLRRIQEQHEGKPTFISRLRKAGLLDSV
ncbi:MAG: hypothetical protein FJY54_08560 [Betaproteobacteria bacterium]|nr:hypothetical protein [Betaproteobacteria bacterium]